MIGHNKMLAVGLAILMLAGCDAVPTEVDADGRPTVRVIYEGNPLADVVVRLHAVAGGPVVDQSISDAEGQAAFRQLPTPEPAAYQVSLLSASDGGWLMDPKLTERFTTDLRLKPFAQNPSQLIELPRGIVRVLSPRN